MIAIVDYGVGNLFSLKSSFAAIGEDAFVTSSAQEIRDADKILLPGVGAFEDAARKLRQSGLADVVCQEVEKGKLLLGICLGMQLLFEKSLEYGEHEGLGFIPGVIRPLADAVPENLKIPQMGWNGLQIIKKSPLLQYTRPGEYVSFVHSFYAADCAPFVTSVADYGIPVTATVQRDNVYGCQFHPEKSGPAGLKILKAFSETEG